MSGGGKSGSSSKSTSTSQSESQQQRQSYVDPAQAPFLDWLRSQGMQTAQQQVGQIGGFAQGLSENLLGQGQKFLSSLGGGGVAMPGVRDQTLSVPALGQSAVQGVIDQVGADIAQQLQRQMGGAGGIATQFAAGGGLGGGREGVERGLAQEASLASFARSAANLRNEDLARQQQLGTQLAISQGQLGLQADALRQQGALGLGQLANQGAGIGLSALPQLMNLGLSGYGAQFSPLQSLAQLVGAPTVLDTATGWEKSTGTSTSKGKSQQGFLDAMSGFF